MIWLVNESFIVEKSTQDHNYSWDHCTVGVDQVSVGIMVCVKSIKAAC